MDENNWYWWIIGGALGVLGFLKLNQAEAANPDTDSPSGPKPDPVTTPASNQHTHAMRKGGLSNPLPGYSYSWGYGQRWGKQHNGIDIGAPCMTPILAAADGVVRAIRWDNSAGWYIAIEHENEYNTLYLHLAGSAATNEICGNEQKGEICKTNLAVGQHVEQNQVIGYVGDTGNSSAPHLHFEIRIGEWWKIANAVDPIPHLSNPSARKQGKWN
jgi:murein DD-endopeptidase MepM/ murein hydrolase activator NlpD